MFIKLRRPLIATTCAIMAVVSLTGLSSPAKADAIDQGRITYEASTGELTQAEVRRLRKMEREYDRMERRAWSDGTLTREEYRKLRRLEHKIDITFHRQSTDNDRRWWAK